MTFSITIIIIIISCLVSYKAFNDPTLFHKLKHDPFRESQNGEYYRMLTSGFVHGSWTHLIINMYVLYEFGSVVETLYLNIFGVVKGRILFVVLYLLTLVIADIPTFLKHKDNLGYASIGASGAVSGILFTYVLFGPWSWLGLFFVIPIPAIVFAILYLVYSSWAINNTKSRIDHSAHFMGAVAGMVITALLYPDVIGLFMNNLMDFQSPW